MGKADAWRPAFTHFSLLSAHSLTPLTPRTRVAIVAAAIFAAIANSIGNGYRDAIAAMDCSVLLG